MQWKCVRHQEKTYGSESKSKYKRRVANERTASAERVALKLLQLWQWVLIDRLIDHDLSKAIRKVGHWELEVTTILSCL